MVVFSIIVPVYNVEKYLNRCLNSILNQSFNDFELIIVDDGSTDNSLTICKQFSTLYNNVEVIHKNNGGLSSARNVGLTRASGKYIIFIDSDDFISSNMLFDCYNILSHDENIDILNFGYNKITDKGDLISIHSYYNAELTVRDALIELLMDCNINSFAWSNIYKRELFEEIHFPINTYYEDKYTTYRIYDKAKKIMVIPTLYYNYVVRVGSICNETRLPNIVKGLVDNAFALLEQYDFAVKRGLNEVLLHLENRINVTLVSMIRTLYKHRCYDEIQKVYNKISEFHYQNIFHAEIIFFLRRKCLYSYLMFIYRLLK